MRKRIGVFIGEVGREYQKEFAENIKNVANARGYDVFIFNNFGSYFSTYIFDSGERDVINIPVFSEFAGVVSLADTFDMEGMEGKLLRKISAEADCPVVSVRNGSKKTYRLVFDDYQTAYDMTSHFIKDHGFTNICFMSGPYGVDDAIERLDGFKDAMKDSGLEIDENAIFEGDFWKFKSKPAAEQFVGCYGGKPQAIVCANDYMALGLFEEFKAMGLRIPEDIALSGFDEIIEGMVSNPVLTTVKFPVFEMAQEAIDTIEAVNNGRDVSREKSLVGSLCFKGSCGCNYNTPKVDLSVLVNQISNDYINIRTSTFITADIQNRITEADKLAFVDDYTDRFNFKKNYLCLCTGEHKDDNPYSEQMELRAVFPLSDAINSSPLINSKFDRKYILPEGSYDSSKPACFIILPIHHKNSTYGYIATEWSDEKDYTKFLAPYTEALALAYDDLRQQKEFSEFVEIKKQNLVDPLTGILNRRGFETGLASVMSGNTNGTEIISFVSADLDNLKPINDNYGHHEGDIAIQTFANVLTKICGENDVCARVGGDEFYLVITSPDRAFHDKFIETVTNELNECNKILGKAYDIHASVGICTIDISMLDKAFEHIQTADNMMYEAKKAYKKNR